MFNHEGGINTTEKSICAAQGLSCPALYGIMELISFLAIIFDIIIIPFLVYLSFAKVKDSLLKYFTLNTMAICIVTTIAVTVIDAINVTTLFVGVDEKIYRIRRWARRCLSFGYIWSHALALYVAIVCYLAFVNPIFYMKHFVNKSQKYHYLIIHISLFLWNSCVDFIREQFSISILYHLTHLILFFALFIVTAMAIIKICKYKPAGISAIEIVKLRRKRLFSFAVYSCAAEIIVLPRFFYSLTSVICYFAGCEHQLQHSVFYRTIHQFIYVLHELNSIVVVISTIIAFGPYRQAILSIIGKHKPQTTKINPLNNEIIGNNNNTAGMASKFEVAKVRK